MLIIKYKFLRKKGHSFLYYKIRPMYTHTLIASEVLWSGCGMAWL
jgi:hypothetical protein